MSNPQAQAQAQPQQYAIPTVDLRRSQTPSRAGSAPPRADDDDEDLIIMDTMHAMVAELLTQKFFDFASQMGSVLSERLGKFEMHAKLEEAVQTIVASSMSRDVAHTEFMLSIRSDVTQQLHEIRADIASLRTHFDNTKLMMLQDIRNEFKELRVDVLVDRPSHRVVEEIHREVNQLTQNMAEYDMQRADGRLESVTYTTAPNGTISVASSFKRQNHAAV